MQRGLCFLLVGLTGFSTVTAWGAEPSPELAAAIKAYHERKFDDAQAALTELEQKEPQNAEVAYYLGLVAKRLKQPDAFVRWAEKATELDPHQAKYFISLGDAYGAKAKNASLFQQMSSARKCCDALEKAVALEPASIEARAALIDFCRQAPSLVGGGMDKAYRQAEELQKLDLTGGTQLLVTLFVAEHKFEAALDACVDALKTKPDDYVILYLFGRTAAISGQRVDEGLEKLKHCLTLPPPPGAAAYTHVWLRIGNLEEKKGDVAAAKEAYTESVKLDSANGDAADALAKLSK